MPVKTLTRLLVIACLALPFAACKKEEAPKAEATAAPLTAPKTGDAAAWGPRLALGHDGLTASAIAGKGAMPPRGGGSDLTDTEVSRAVAYLANLAGAGYTEPPVEQ